MSPAHLQPSCSFLIIVALDYNPQYVSAQTIPVAIAVEGAEIFLLRILLRHKTRQFLRSDWKTPFLLKRVNQLLRLAKTVHITTAYNSQTNDFKETVHHTLEPIFSISGNQDNTTWEATLP